MIKIILFLKTYCTKMIILKNDFYIQNNTHKNLIYRENLMILDNRTTRI